MYLGIDTSAYTCSLALIDDNEKLIWEKRELLNVPKGDRGMAQSEALFQHIQTLPKLVEAIPAQYWKMIKAAGVSISPRPVKGSYMPVFIAGQSAAAMLGSSLQIPVYHTTHQEGHIAAGIHTAGGPQNTRFLAVHLSGGTTELLAVDLVELGRYQVIILGGTTDLHAGQFIDRVGVRLGLSFPAGKELEKLALRSSPGSASLLPSSVKGYELSFSGVESAAQRLIQTEKKPADIARAVEGCVSRTIVKVLEKALAETDLPEVLFVGGVSSNKFIRSDIEKRLAKRADFYWADPKLSTDNAVGIAIITREKALAG